MRNTQDKIFIAILAATTMMVTVIWARNIYHRLTSTQRKTISTVEIYKKDPNAAKAQQRHIARPIPSAKIEKIRKRIKAAGILPRPAKYWKKIQ